MLVCIDCWGVLSFDALIVDSLFSLCLVIDLSILAYSLKLYPYYREKRHLDMSLFTQ